MAEAWIEGHLAEIEERLEQARAAHDAADTEAQRCRDEAGALHGEIAELDRQRRPLHPYAPPQDRPLLAAHLRQSNVRMEQQDITALQLWAPETGCPAGEVVTAALRLFVPAQVYARALEHLEQEFLPAAGAGAPLHRGA